MFYPGVDNNSLGVFPTVVGRPAKATKFHIVLDQYDRGVYPALEKRRRNVGPYERVWWKTREVIFTVKPRRSLRVSGTRLIEQ